MAASVQPHAAGHAAYRHNGRHGASSLHIRHARHVRRIRHARHAHRTRHARRIRHVRRIRRAHRTRHARYAQSPNRGAYAQLVKTATQSFTAPVDGVVTFNEQSKTDNIIVSNGAITFLTPGTYKLEYNLNVQDVQAGAASTGNVSIYLRSLGTPINGTQVTFPLTNTDVEVISGGRLSPCPRTMYSIAL